MMINYLKKILLFVILSFSILACTQGNDVDDPNVPQPTPTPTPSDLIDVTTSPSAAIQAVGGEATIEFIASADWSASTSSDWISISPTSGTAGSAKITVKVAENTTYDERNGSITIKSGTASQNITITQKQIDTLIISQNEYVVASSGDVIKVELQSNCDYEIRMPNVDWISKAETRAVNTYTHYFNVAENKTSNQRTAEIVFVNKENRIEESVKIIQEGNGGYGRYEGHDWVDLGLSVKWATCNVGAKSPEDYGGYFAWGETTTKNNYTWGTCFDCLDKNGDSWSIYKKEGKTKIEPNSGHDTARQNWGGSWRMPTIDELEELNSKCTWTWTSKDGHYGYLLTGPNGNSIFLPAAGSRSGMSSYINVGEYGYYWSSTLSSSLSYRAQYLYFNSSNHYTNFYSRRDGLSVRPVTE